ncbi:hypothetical protein STCU_04974 [Strigomonas culicis]|nr:hypothetical protein STCU_04974 [Strigomonas culicis]|eukprot:EPY28606.1 hypothetical protein STCU_04974 [Strigomonas culicis]
MFLCPSDFIEVAAINGLRKFGYKDEEEEEAEGDERRGGGNKRHCPPASSQRAYGHHDKVQYVMALDKENGECGHIAAFESPTSPSTHSSPQKFWFIGSKNVHIVFSFAMPESEFDLYNGSRYQYAKKIARLFRSTLLYPPPAAGPRAAERAERDRTPPIPQTVHRFFRHICEERYTACCETIFADSQHLVHYQQRNEMRFFALTRNAHYNQFNDFYHKTTADGKTGGAWLTIPPALIQHNFSNRFGICEDMMKAKHFFVEVCQFYFVQHSPITVYPYHKDSKTTATHPKDKEAYTALIDAISRKPNTEGSVMYGFSYRCPPSSEGAADDEATERESGATGTPIMVVHAIWKQKAYPYVMERAVRELIIEKQLAGKALRSAIQLKIQRMQYTRLRPYFEQWAKDRMDFFILFAAYLHLKKIIIPFSRNNDNDKRFDIRNQWRTLQDDFGRYYDGSAGTNQNGGGDAEMLSLCKQYELPSAATNKNSANATGNTNSSLPFNEDLDVIKFIGPQGCGKSTLARALCILLRNVRPPPTGANADHAAGAQASACDYCYPCWANQDEAGDRRKYLAVIHNAAHCTPDGGAPKVTHLLLDKMNLDKHLNDDYRELKDNICCIVCFYHPDDERDVEEAPGPRGGGRRHLLQVCYDRVLERGAGHRTIKVLPHASQREKAMLEKKIHTFLSSAVQSCEDPAAYETESTMGRYLEEETILYCSVLDDLTAIVRQIWSALRRPSGQQRHPLPALADLNHPTHGRGGDTPDDPHHRREREERVLRYAIHMSQAYERVIAAQPHAPLYACLAITAPEDTARIVQLVQQADAAVGLLHEKVLQQAFHITTKFFVGQADPFLMVHLGRRNGRTLDRQLRCTRILYDANGVCMEVANERPSPLPVVDADTATSFPEMNLERELSEKLFPCDNPYPHITIANRKGFPPKYSNELLHRFHHKQEAGANPSVQCIELTEEVLLSGTFMFR